MGIRQGYNDWLRLLQQYDYLYEIFQDEVGHNKRIGWTTDCDYAPLDLMIKLVHNIEERNEEIRNEIGESRT